MGTSKSSYHHSEASNEECKDHDHANIRAYLRCSSKQERQFLQATTRHTPQHAKYDIRLLIGDFNVKLGSKERQGLQCTIGPHGTANETNDNGERLISVCRNNAIKIGKIFFKHKIMHKKTWRSPDNNTQNEIDYICINNKWCSSLT